jgi:DNA polymerase III epsilon subunit-like protein
VSIPRPPEPIQDLFFSVDIETDGEAPGVSSMLSIGAVVISAAGQVQDHETFYRTLHRLPGANPTNATMNWWDQYPKQWAEARADAIPPEQAMKEFAEWVKVTCRRRGANIKPVFVAHPAGFDFTWVYYYCHRFLRESVFEFSALDMKTYAMAVLGTSFWGSGKSNWPPPWTIDSVKYPLTHNALEDALHQAYIFSRMLEYTR